MWDRTMIITGAASPNGNPIVDLALANGINVILLSAWHSRAQAAIEKGVSSNYKSHVLGFAQNPQAQLKRNMEEAPELYREDTTQQDVLRWIYDRFGSIDIVVNGSGGHERREMDTTDKAFWHHDAEVPEGAFFNVMYAMPYLEKSVCPRVINITTDDGACGGWFKNPAFAAARGGIIALTREMARELGPKGITVNCVLHSHIEGSGPDALTDEERNELLNRTPLGRICTLKDLAGIVNFLASEQASFITGQVINVNGGLLLG